MIKSKTMWFAFLLMILGAVQTALPELKLPPEWYGVVNMLVAIMVAGLRFITTQPLSEK